MNHRMHDRRGVAVPLVAVMMVMLMGMTAFVVDVGYIAKSRQELQTSADSAALAATMQLLDKSQLQSPYNYDQSGVTTAAAASAQQYSHLNPAARVAIALQSGEIVCGYLSNPRDPNCVLDTHTTPFNAVQITARRDSQANGALTLFFGRVMGMNVANVTSTATAVYDGNVKGFKIDANTPPTSKLLPFALDVVTWNNCVAGNGPDTFSYNSDTTAVSSGGDGIKEVTLYPFNNLAPGNFGTVNLGQTNNSTQILDRQILYGPNASDLANMGGQIALGPDGTLTLIGNPGLSAAVKSSLQEIIGQPRIIPLYQSPVQGNGANAQYTIVGFAGIIVTAVQLTGPNKAVTIQPQFCIDPTAFTGGPITNKRFVYSGVQLAR